MKTVLTLFILVVLAATGIASCSLFQRADYASSALLTITCFLTVTLWVAVLGNRKSFLH